MLEKVKWVLLLGGIVFLSSVIMSSCNNKRKNKELTVQNEDVNEHLSSKDKEVKDLEKKLEKAKNKIIKLEQKVGKNKDDLVYMNLKFSSDENFYKEAFDTLYYSDPTCTIIIDNPRFLSSKIDPEEADNGLAIYCLRLDNGEICYTPRKNSPYLITEAKWQEMKKEKKEKATQEK